MKQRKILLLAIMTILALTTVLSGCAGSGGNQSGSSSSSNTNVESNTGATTTEPNTEPPKDPVTLNFWFPGHDANIVDAVRSVITDFEAKHPHIKVEYTSIPWGDYFQKLSVAYAGGIEPDVHGLGFGQLISTVDQDQYMDLNTFIRAQNWPGKDDIFPSILNAGQWNGGQYGLLFPEVRPFSWRKDFYKEADLDPEKPPATLDELFEVATKLTVKDRARTIRAGIDVHTQNGEQSFMSLLLLLGEDIYDDSGNPTFDSPVAIALLERMVDWFNQGVIIPSHQQQLEGSLYQNSMAATGFPGSNISKFFRDNFGLENVGWSVPPQGPNGDRTALMLGTFLTMSKNSKHPEEAWQLLSHFFEPEQVFAFTGATGFVPPLQSLKEAFSALSPENEVIFNTMDDARGYRPSANWGVIIKYLRIALEEAYYGQKSPEDAMKENAKKAREELGITN